jgi:hypothetical protein
LGIQYYDKAIAAFDKVTQLSPQKDDGYYYLGVAFGKKNNEAMKAKYFKEAAARGNQSAYKWLKENGHV